MSVAPEPRVPPAAPPPLLLGPDTGPIDRRASALIWGIGTIALGGLVAFLLAQGDVRTVTLVLLTVLGLLCLSPRRGIFIIFAFLPFMYFLRRQVLYFNEFSQRDPILLFPPLVAIAMFLGFIIFYSERLNRYLRGSAVLKAALALMGLYVIQMFNPLQGNILVGIAGAIYFIVPMLWIFMGLLIDERDLRRLLRMIIAIGVFTALYGIYQHYFGLSGVEEYELESKGFLKAFGRRVRVMSTFAGLGDYSVYLSTAAFLAFAHYWRSKTNALWLALMGVIVFAMLWVAIRTSILVLFFSIAVFLIVYTRRLGVILVRGLAAIVIVGVLYGYAYTMTPMDVFESHGSSNPFLVHTIAGVVHPTEESTFQKRVETWKFIVTRGLLEHPFGRGLGSTTTAAMKFGGGERFEADSYLFEIIYGSGPIAAILFIALITLFTRDALRLSSGVEDNFHHKVAIGMMAAYFLGSVFGVDVRDSVNGPIAWLVLGWMAREYVDRSETGEIAVPSAA